MSIDNTFYAGYEQYHEIAICFASGSGSDKNEIHIWRGYIFALLDCMLEQFNHDRGILYTYFTQEAWCDGEDWEIPDLVYEINQLKNFSYDKISQELQKDYKNILTYFPELIKYLVSFLQHAQENKQKVIIHPDIDI